LQENEDRQLNAYTPRSSQDSDELLSQEPNPIECSHDVGTCVVCLMNPAVSRLPIGCWHCVCKIFIFFRM